MDDVRCRGRPHLARLPARMDDWAVLPIAVGVGTSERRSWHLGGIDARGGLALRPLGNCRSASRSVVVCSIRFGAGDMEHQRIRSVVLPSAPALQSCSCQ